MRASRTSRGNDVGKRSGPRGARLWVFRIVALVGVPAALLMLLEAGLRLGGVGSPTTFFVETADPGTVVTNQFFGRRFFPAAIARTPDVERFQQVKERGTYRIFVLGGSAAMGFPEPAFGVGRILEALLREEYEGLNVEVINAAMTAVNSHVVLPIARACARYEPDAMVVYLGNNEVVGPYGPSSVFGDFGSSLPIVRSVITLRGTRTGQMLYRAMIGWGGDDTPRQWKGMAMFLDKQIPWGDPRLKSVYENFRANLRDISQAGLDAGAEVLLSTVAVNLADSAPFASRSPELGAEELEKWETAYREGVANQTEGLYAAAIESFQRAAAIDDSNADLAFRLGQCLRALGQAGEARQRFARARDLDTLRFRADSRINGVIRETAAQPGEAKLALIDAEKLVEDASADGLTGAEWFYEHVHFKFAGNYLLARTIADSLREDLEHKGARKTGRTATGATIASDLVLTDWDRYRMARDIAALMEQPPFTNQLDHAQVMASTSIRPGELSANRDTKSLKAEAVAAYEAGVAGRPRDLHLRRRYAELLDAAGSASEAAKQWRTLLHSAPENLYWLTSLGASLRDAGELTQAIAAFRNVIEIDGGNASAHFGLGSVLQKQGMLDEAAQAYQEALRRQTAYAEAENNLGLIAMERGHSAGAVEHFERAIEMRPGFAEAHQNLGVILHALGRGEEASKEFRRAIEIDQESALPRYHLGASLAADGRFTEALPLLTEAVRLDPASANSHHALGGVLAATGRIEEALHHLEEAVRLRPMFAEAHYNKGLLLARQSRLRDAIESYRQAIAAQAEYPEAWNNMGTAFARQGQMQEAAQCFKEALRLRTDFEEARRNLENIHAAGTPN